SNRIVQLVFLSAVLSSVFCDNEAVVKSLIEASNLAVREVHNVEIPLPDIDYLSIRYRNGTISKLDTSELLPEPEVEASTDDSGTVYKFNVALKNLVIDYQFAANYAYAVGYKGFSVTFGKNVFQIEARVSNQDGKCTVGFERAEVVELEDLKPEYKTGGLKLVESFKSQLLDGIRKRLPTLINEAIYTEVAASGYGASFRKHACELISRN
ncbi:hypothetical protein L9G16_18170, partial [Shewanella sp. A25]|nr:hypothetical protein [Shewanella shenzhenensis]